MTFGTRWRVWSRHCGRICKVAVSIPDVSGIFYRHNPTGCTMALGSTQPRTKIKIRNISLGGGGRSTGDLTTFMCRLSWKLGPSTSGNLQGLSRSVQGFIYLLPYWSFTSMCLTTKSFHLLRQTRNYHNYNSNSTCGVLFEHLMFNERIQKLSCLYGIPAFTFVRWIVSSVSLMLFMYLHNDFVSCTVILSRSSIPPLGRHVMCFNWGIWNSSNNAHRFCCSSALSCSLHTSAVSCVTLSVCFPRAPFSIAAPLSLGLSQICRPNFQQ
jgi:hypothetical protein